MGPVLGTFEIIDVVVTCKEYKGENRVQVRDLTTKDELNAAIFEAFLRYREHKIKLIMEDS